MKNNGIGKSALLKIMFLFLVGHILNYIAYSSFDPIITGVLFFILGMMLLIPFCGKDSYEIYAFQVAFVVYWITGGISAVYANLWNDPFQVDSDASTFFELASFGARGYELSDLKIMTEGSGAIVLWRFIYDFFESIGFEKLHYIGISVNVMLVALTCAMGVSIATLIFGKDRYRINQIILLFSSCGLFWLFASLHLRDGVVLFSVTFLMIFWVRFLRDLTAMSFILVLMMSIISVVEMEYLRKEFLFVPIAMCFSGFMALLFDATIKGWNRMLVYIVLALLTVPIAYLFFTIKVGLSTSLNSGYEDYSELATISSEGGSLGTAIIVNAPFPVRLVLGSIYLFIFPIPFWTGFQTGTVYNLWKSCNALFMYILTPLFLLSILKIFKNKALRTAPIQFLLFTFLGFTIAIAATSLETRHFGVFLVPAMVLALIPDFQLQSDRILIKSFISVFLIFMLSIHLVWAILKM